MESKGDKAQREMPFFAAVQAPQIAPAEFITRSSWEGSIRYSTQRSGMDDYEIADRLHISHGYMSKVLKGTAGLYGTRLVRFMKLTGSLAPLQWLADQMGCDLVQRDPAKARIAELERELNELKRVA
jgi:transcriptional regulator with XRE-family HTH domain